MMGSLVAEALAGAGTLEKATLSQQVEQLESHIRESRSEICEVIQQKYLDFFPGSLSSARDMKERVNSVSNKIDQEMGRIRQHLDTQGDVAPAAEIEEIQKKLTKTEEAINSVSAIVEVADVLEEVKLLSAEEQYYTLAQLLLKADSKILLLSQKAEAGSQDTGFIDGRVIPALKEEVTIYKEKLCNDLITWWETILNFNGQRNSPSCYVKLEIVAECSESEVEDRLSAAYLIGCLEEKMRKFGQKLLTGFFEMAIERNVAFSLESGTLQEKVTHTLMILAKEATKKTSAESLDCERAEAILVVLEQIVTALQQVLGNYYLRTKINTSEDGENRLSFLAYLGQLMGSDFLETILNDCLKPAIPSEISEMDKFHELVEKAKGVAEIMQKVGLLPREQSVSLEKFLLAKDDLFLNRRCQKLLGDARELVKSELHDIITVGIEKSEQELFEELGNELAEKNSSQPTDSKKLDILWDSNVYLPKAFQFPRCKISRSAVSLIQLIEKTLEEAWMAESPSVAGHLFQITRNMMDLFVDLSMLQHDEQLKNIPSTAAVFYNNCYFLSHRLMSLGWEVTPKLAPAMGLPPNCPNLTFIDYVPQLREMAAECVHNHLRKTKDQLDEFLDRAGRFNFNIRSDPNAAEVCRKAVKGCILQIEQLNRVWKDIFTSVVHLKAMSSIVSHYLNTINNQILALEDIGDQESNCLSALLKEFAQSLEAIFIVEKGSEIRVYCGKSFDRHREIILCLTSSMQQIEDRWASGKGPLAYLLTASQLKQLIRALFQNNDRRAVLLSKIK